MAEVDEDFLACSGNVGLDVWYYIIHANVPHWDDNWSSEAFIYEAAYSPLKSDELLVHVYSSFRKDVDPCPTVELLNTKIYTSLEDAVSSDDGHTLSSREKVRVNRMAEADIVSSQSPAHYCRVTQFSQGQATPQPGIIPA